MSHVTVAERFYQRNEMVGCATKPCEWKVGDSVMFTNDAGLVFGPFVVIGFAKPENEVGGRFVHINFDSPWFPVHPWELSQ